MDSDCESAGLDGRCEDGICVARSVEPQRDAGMDGGGGSDAGMSSDPNSCFGSMRCDDGKLCFKDQCVEARDVERFVCDPITPDDTELVPFEMPVVEFVSTEPPKNMKVRACRVNDASCEDPDGRYEDTDGTGVIRLELPRGFSGFLEVTSDDALPALWYFTKPLVVSTKAKPLRVVAPDTLTFLSSITGFPSDASKGLVILEAFDCAKVAVGGVHFEENTKAALPFYLVNSIPNRQSTVTVRDEMANEAPGGFANATPGFTLFTARIGVDGTILGAYNANVRASTVTYLDIHP